MSNIDPSEICVSPVVDIYNENMIIPIRVGKLRWFFVVCPIGTNLELHLDQTKDSVRVVDADSKKDMSHEWLLTTKELFERKLGINYKKYRQAWKPPTFFIKEEYRSGKKH